MRQALRESEAVGSFLRYLSPVPQNLVSIFEEDGEKRKYVTSQELDLHCFCFLEAMQVKIIYSYCHISAYLEISRYTLSELKENISAELQKLAMVSVLLHQFRVGRA